MSVGSMKALTRFEEHFRTWSVVLAGAVMVCVCDGGVKLHVNVCVCMRVSIHMCVIIKFTSWYGICTGAPRP